MNYQSGIICRQRRQPIPAAQRVGASRYGAICKNMDLVGYRRLLGHGITWLCYIGPIMMSTGFGRAGSGGAGAYLHSPSLLPRT
jgi:hypothetical protein